MAGVLLVLHLASPGGMGFGDVKLGLLLGRARRCPVARPRAASPCCWPALLGALGGLVLMVRHRRRDVTLPFGPYLVAGAVRCALVLAGRLTPGDPARTVRRYHARVLRYLTAGESHGQALVVIVEGLPAGLPITVGGGAGRAGPPPARLRPRAPDALRGRRAHAARRDPPRPHARLAGGHRDQEQRVVPQSDRWHQEMSPAPGRTEQPLTQPRPGHADLAGMQKYGFGDARDVLERASARETAARVAAGCLAKALLAELGVGGPEPRRADGPGAGRRARPGPARPTSTPSTSRPCAASTTPRPGGHDRRDRGGREGGRLARRHRRGPGLRRPRRAGQPRPLGPQARRACWPRPS